MNRLIAMCSLLLWSLVATSAFAEEKLTPATVLAASTASDWRAPTQSNLLHLQLPSGGVIFELAPDFAPNHLVNLRKLADAKYFDGLAIVRSQDNYVAQWGDPNAEEAEAKSQGDAAKELQPEFFRKLKDLQFNAINSRDAYADTVGFSRGFATGIDGSRAWLTHCYGALGVGRDMAANSGNSAELYVVTGHSPRHLDRNVTLIGRALTGMQHLSSLPRGTGTLGFYETPEEMVQITSIRFGDQLPLAAQSSFEIMRTDTPTFNKFVQSRTTRMNEWFLDPTGKIEVCNVGVPVRQSEQKEEVGSE